MQMPFHSSSSRADRFRNPQYGASSRAHRMDTPHQLRSMSQATWDKINASFNPHVGMTPEVLKHGLPPTPWALTSSPSDSRAYTEAWRKLIFVEMNTALASFRSQLKRPNNTVHEKAPLGLQHLSGPDERGRWSATIYVRNKAVELDIAAADVPHTIFSLQDDAGWFYVGQASDVKQFPMTVSGWLYDDDFSPSSSPPQAPYAGVRLTRAPYTSACVPFESFLTFRYRYSALHLYPSICPEVRAALERPGSCPEGPPPQLLPVSSTCTSQLNASQQAVLQSVRGPVEFVQGPPGTGKSTFIVEFLRSRVPTSAAVLICTTTNKAIDSLAEKLKAAGFGSALLAFGNESRLGATSVTFLLEKRVHAHADRFALANLQDLVNKGVRLVSASTGKLRAAAEQPGPGLSDAEISQERTQLAAELCKCLQPLASLLTELQVRRLTAEARPVLAHVHHLSTRLSSALAAVKARSGSRRALSAAVDDFAQQLGAVNRALVTAIKRHVISTARYYVCTAATSVRLPDRISREFEDEPPAPRTSTTGADSPVNALAKALAASSLTSEPAADSAAAADGTPEFQYVILDEAGAMLEPDVVGTLIHGCQYLLNVGDHLQLPPFTAWQQADEHRYNVSLLQRHAEQLSTSHNRLTEQYRMATPIAKLVSNLFYQGALTTAPSTAARRQRAPAVAFVNVPGQEEKVKTSYVNRAEVEAVVAAVRQERADHPSQLINVITFYKTQMYAIKDALKAARLLVDTASEHDRLDVTTVDSMQGREADIIILSCTRTTALGFLQDLRRLNVALSRAKEMLYVIGFRRLFQTCNSNAWRAVVSECS